MRGLSVGRSIRIERVARRREAGYTTLGFTIVEVLIVLAISGALFVSAVILISGRQSQTAFEEAARQVQSQVQQVLNEVSAGYYPDNSSFKCTASPSGTQPPTLGPGSSTQGTNVGCIFVGKALQFKVADTDPEQFIVYTIAGVKKGSTNSAGDIIETTSLADARPVLVARSDPSQAADYPDNSSAEQLQHGLTVNDMWYRDAAGIDHKIGVVAFVNGFASGTDDSGELLSGSGNVAVVAADNTGEKTALGKTKYAMVTALNSTGDNPLANGAFNPKGGIFICFESGTTQDYAVVQIGGGGRDLSVTLHIIDKTGPTCTYT